MPSTARSRTERQDDNSMARVKQFNLPDPGEGLVEAEIVTWKVKVGDTVKVNDIIVEIETAKSLVELPVPYAGTVTDLLVPEGETVPVGTPIIAVDTGVEDGTPSAPARGPAPAAEDDEIEAGKIGGAAPGGRGAVLGGYGPRATQGQRPPPQGARPPPPAAAPRPRPPRGPSPPPAAAPWARPPKRVPNRARRAAAPAAVPPPAPAPTPSPAARPGGARALAKPPVRKYAKDRGVDLADVAGSGEGGIISRSDVDQHLQAAAGAVPAGGPGAGT